MSISFDIAPFNDDFESPSGAKYNNYMRILFRPGYAVQARELTQLQSIVQNQIKSFGNHIFQDGSPVHGGHISLDTGTKAIQLNSQYNNVDISLDDFFINGQPTLITNADGAVDVKAVVVAVDDTQNNPVLVVKYMTGNEFKETDILQVATGLITQAQVFSANATSVSTTASINDGVFYSGGFFVQVNPQTILLDATTTTPTYRVGLQIEEGIIDEVSDTKLLDPAQGSFNYQAPGAHRYQYVLALSKRTLDSIDDSSFYELLRVENGLITQQIDYPIYADLEKSLARRTFDQSGDFTVKPFVVSIADNTDNTSQFAITVEPGKAYVKGFEFETIGVQKIMGDKALATNTVNSFGMSLEFGNIITTANLLSGNQSGAFDIANFANVDIHIVPTANINTTTQLLYNGSKIGTARVRDIEFVGLGQYYSYLTDIAITPNGVSCNGGTLTTFNLNSSLFTAYTNAFANVTVTVNNAAGVIDFRKIISSAAPAAGNIVCTVDRPLSYNSALNGNAVALWYGIKDAESFVTPPTTANNPGNVYSAQGQAANSYFASMDIAPSGKDIAGNTVVSDTQFNKLIFPLPQQYIAPNSIINASFYHRKNLFSQSFVAGNLAITSGSGLTTGETFPYGFSGLLPDNTANANFLVLVKDKSTSNRTNGEVIIFNNGTVVGGNGVYQTDSTHLSINTGSTGTFLGDIYFTVKVTNASQASVARRGKAVVGNVLQTTIRTLDHYSNGGIAVIGNATSFIDTANGFVWYTSRGTIPNTPGSNLSLFIPDVFNIVKIYDSGDGTKVPNTLNAIDITNSYYLDSGQRDNYYDHAKLILKPGFNPPTGQTVVMLQYFSHDSVSGFFDADSYAPNVYASGAIPFYASPQFGTLSLRDSIDFRPTRTIGTVASVTSFNLNGLSLPQPDNAFQSDYSFYLPRIDKLQLTKDKSFRIKQGTPSLYPQAPTDTSDAMTLYVMSIPAYTPNVREIQLQYIDNKRYTMHDIGVLDTRIQQLEYYSALSQLEAQAIREKILYQDNVTAKDSYGIIADDFGSFSIADNLNTDLACFMEQGAMSAYKATKRLVDLDLSSTTGSTPTLHSKTYTLPYTEAPAITSGFASDEISVQPFLFAQFKGHIQLTPETDAHYALVLPAFVASPPSHTTPSSPVIPAPPSHPTLIMANTVAPVTKTIVGPVGYYGVAAEKYRTDYSYFNGTRVVYSVDNHATGFGFINPVLHWYGVPVVKSEGSGVLASSPPNLGSSIQLAPVSQNSVSSTVRSTSSRLLY